MTITNHTTLLKEHSQIRKHLLHLNADGSIRFTPLTWSLIAFLLLLLFLPLLIYPNGLDNSLFFVAGQKIYYQGAVHYRDIVDVKPPLIYYFNAVAITLFGNHPMSARILDLLAQMTTCLFLVLLIRRATGRDVHAFIAALLYTLLYLGLNYECTTQVESFVGLLTLPAVWLFMFRRTLLGFIGIGILGGIAMFFKFTFGIIIAAFLIGDMLLYSDTWKIRFQHFIGLSLGLGIIVGLFALYLTFFDAWHGFLNMQQFLNGYTGTAWESVWTSIRLLLQLLPARLADEYTLVAFLGTIWGIFYAAAQGTHKASKEDNRETSTVDRRTEYLLLRISTILFVLLLVTVVIEGKWFVYHILRFFPFGAILASFGLISGIHLLLKKSVGRFKWFLYPLVAATLIGLSPVSRCVFHYGSIVLLLTSGLAGFDSYTAHSDASDKLTMKSIEQIGTYIKEHKEEQEKLFVNSEVAAMVYMASDYIPEFSIFHSCFLTASYAPDEWRDSTQAFLLREHPRFIVTETEESHIQVFMEMNDVWNMLQNEYNVVMETPFFLIYEKVCSHKRYGVSLHDSTDQ